MTNAGLGSVGARYAVDLARTEPIIFYAAAREWARKIRTPSKIPRRDCRRRGDRQ